MELKILCVHGVGGHPTGGPWEGEWKRSIEEPLARLDADVEPVIEFVYLDDVFDQFAIGPLDVLEALAKLGASGIGSLLRQPRGLGDNIRWTAGMIVQWVENSKLRRLSRMRLQQRMQEFDPHIVVAHSLGSLVCYDTFTSAGGADLIANRRFVSAGSQIGNPFVVGNFSAGRLDTLASSDFWYHLFNAEDEVFTAEIRLSSPNFAQVETTFDIQGIDHDVTQYMSHAKTVATVWSDAVMALRQQPLGRRFDPTPAELARIAKGPARIALKPQKRALLVGINEYGGVAPDLAGCVNDVFLMSALLQESGFDAEDIRIVLDDRATTGNVRDRLEWLLDDARDGDTRFFYYSGHGAQMPSYGPDERVDRVQETLVLRDFDWTAGRAFTDENFHALYSQLPYGMRFIAMFDCCNSGGMTRAGGGPRVRGIDAPDDIRHRMLRWDARREMWVDRDLRSPNAVFDKQFNAGRHGKGVASTHKLGQAMALRGKDGARMKREAAARGHFGPYLPVLIHACRAEQFSYEYQHGSVAHGAFTYSLVKTLRKDRRGRGRLSFEGLVETVGRELAELGYDQVPSLVAPKDIAAMTVPLKT